MSSVRGGLLGGAEDIAESPELVGEMEQMSTATVECNTVNKQPPPPVTGRLGSVLIQQAHFNAGIAVLSAECTGNLSGIGGTTRGFSLSKNGLTPSRRYALGLAANFVNLLSRKCCLANFTCS